MELRWNEKIGFALAFVGGVLAICGSIGIIIYQPFWPLIEKHWTEKLFLTGGFMVGIGCCFLPPRPPVFYIRPPNINDK